MEKISDDEQPTVKTVQLDFLQDRPVVPGAADATNLAAEGSADAPSEDSASEPAEPEQAEGPGAKHAGRFAWLPISSLAPGKNGRGGASLDVSDLVESFKGGPQLHNIGVRPVEGARGKYEIMWGHRRVEAQRQLGRRHVWAMIIPATDTQAEIYGLEENLRRKPTDDEVGDVARLVSLHLETHASGRGGDRKSEAYKSSVQLGRVVETGVGLTAKLRRSSASGVRRAARIEKLAVAAVKEALNKKAINVNEADRLGSFKEDQQVQELAALVASKARDRAAPVLTKIRASLEYLDAKFRKPQKGFTPEALQDFRLLATALVESIGKLLAGTVT